MILQARETIKGAEDVEGDELRNVRTIARVYGFRAAAGVAALLNAIGVICYVLVWILGYASYILWPLLLLGAAVVVGAATAPLTSPHDARRLLVGSTLDKVGALVGRIELHRKSSRPSGPSAGRRSRLYLLPRLPTRAISRNLPRATPGIR